VYVPAASIAGLSTPVPDVNTGDQVPPASDVPVKLSNKLMDIALEHNEATPFVPGDELVAVLTTTSAENKLSKEQL